MEGCSKPTLGKRLLSIKEVTQEYGATEWFWRTRIWDGELPYIKAGRKQLIERNDLEHFINKNRTVEQVF